jgi:hypothetical protein
VQNALHAITIASGVRRGHTLWNRDGQALLASLPLAPRDRRSQLFDRARRPTIVAIVRGIFPSFQS